MCFFFSLLPATMLTVVGYFVLFSSTKVDGGVHLFGKTLAIWIFFIAITIVLMATTVTFSGLCPITEMMQHLPTGAGT